MRLWFCEVQPGTRFERLRRYLGHAYWACFVEGGGAVYGLCERCEGKARRQASVRVDLGELQSARVDLSVCGRCACDSWEAKTCDFGALGGKHSAALAVAVLEAHGVCGLRRCQTCAELRIGLTSSGNRIE